MQLTECLILLIVFCGVLPIEIAARSVQIKQQNESDEVANSPVIHIKRTAREIPEMPMDLHGKHMPCDMDSRGRMSYVFAFPNHCIWAYNNRYVSEGHFRIYKTYQLEGFFFGQYYERLKRYEFEPHTYDYNM
ncbi:uncharacterized protein LOC108096750 isoform X2 [Drosophila ficusphila]|uniref:uncharacterized protein LOC108096750 isoform X2 n=1 Tax=Drosophila ficusphila TaxID=30025 RepID=UPI0007E6F61B|nr:uncharacterized protein LOC108096750 isoform X2 [Drosophila ficusphila]